MRVAVVSDIHGNIHALDAVLQALADEAVDEVWCLGDLVGYGARPNECCRAVAGRAALCLAGNHDLGVLGALDLADFSDDAAAAARWTRGVLSGGARAYLESLSPSAERPGAELYHASPRDPVWEYVLSLEAMDDALARTSAPHVLVGHSHVPFAYSSKGKLAFGPTLAGAEADLGDLRWVLNPGSVGQPRDGDPRASYLVLDLGAGRASFRRTAYDVERTQREIREEGLPVLLAERLAGGV
jgi:diadenosine tetraphosphatase ApaH/serine/threonine PP2A family protein phosphatase